jgi:hypothetical protein
MTFDDLKALFWHKGVALSHGLRNTILDIGKSFAKMKTLT